MTVDTEDTVSPSDLERKNLTEWANEPTVGILKEDLEASKPSHDAEVGKIHKWNDLRLVTGPAKPKEIKGRSSVQPKLIRRQAEWRYSALSETFLSSKKMFNVSGRTFEDETAAKQNELVVNWQFDTKLNKVRFIDEYVRTTVDEGTSYVRVGWDRQVTTELVDNPIFEFYPIDQEDQESLQALEQATRLKMENPREFTDIDPAMKAAVEYFLEEQEITIAQQVGTEQVEEEKILVNKPTLEMIDPQNIYIDPSCGSDFDKASFVIISFETSKGELKKDGRYKNLDKVNWEGSTVLAQPDHVSQTPDTFNFKDDTRKKIIAYEYWGMYDIEKDGNLVSIVGTWVGDTMIRLEENPFPDQKPPVVVVPYSPVKRKVTGEPDAELLEDNQKILGAITRGTIDLLGRSANSQQGFSKDFLDTTNKRRFDNGQDYEFNPNIDPRIAIYQHAYPEIPNSALTVIQMQNQDAESLSGVKAFSGGISGDTYGDVAAGIKGMLDASSKREMNILRRLAQGMKSIGSKIISMNAVFMSEEEIVRVTNEEYVVVKREELQGNFDLVVDISTPEIDQARSQDLSFMLQTMGPDMAPELSQMILGEIADLKKMPALAERIRQFQPQPDPIQEQMKQLELQKMQLELKELESQVTLNQAKAQQAMAASQKTQLDSIEQETGTTHARNLQSQKSQAKGNQSLEVTKALLKGRKEGETIPNVPAAIGYNQLSKLMDQTDPEIHG